MPEWAVEGARIRRKPAGRVCRIKAVGPIPPFRGYGALVQDLSRAHWVSSRTLATKWEPAG